MPRSVTVRTGQGFTKVALPGSVIANEGQTVILSDASWALVPATAVYNSSTNPTGYLTDGGTSGSAATVVPQYVRLVTIV